MAKTKKNKKDDLDLNDDFIIDEIDKDLDDEDSDNDEFNLDSLDNDLDSLNDLDFNDDNITSPINLASYINKESETVKYFKELPKETRFSFLTDEQENEIKHYFMTHRDWKYIEKNIDLREIEDNKRKNNFNKIKDVNDIDSLVLYLKSINKEHLISDFSNMSEDELNKIFEHIKTLKPNMMTVMLENRKSNISDVYSEYNDFHSMPEHIDDMGNTARIVGTTIASMGRKGNASNSSIMTINAVKNENIEKVGEEKSRFGLLDSIKRRFVGQN